MWIDIASGQVNAALGSHQAMLPHIQRGHLRPIAAWGGRSPRMPEIPTFQELSFNEPVFKLNGWMPMCAPAGTPEDILRKMSAAIQEARKIWKAEAPEWVVTADRLGVKLD